MSLTRREFLELAARQSLGASIAAMAALSACGPTATLKSTLGLDARHTESLIALIDQIIPADASMPAASQAGTLAYFELLAASEPALADSVQAAVRAADALSRERFSTDLSGLAEARRTAVITAFEKTDPALFARVRDYVYEGYYLQPKVWNLIGYEPFPTGSGGPHMAPFDPALLQRVRAMASRYKSA